MSDCDQNCSNCANKCEQADFREKLNELSSVKKVYAVVSGKGGVGKSLVTSMLAVEMNRQGKKVAVLDADVTGPSIPRAFGITEKAESDEHYLYPVRAKSGIDVMSINLLLPSDTDPVIWRGPVIAGAVKQFWTDVVWNDVDYMIVDMPPGTVDVPLTVFQSLPINGIIIVTTPQDLVSMIVEKAVNMALRMNIPIVGIVENMSYFVCPDCNKKHYIFGRSDVNELAKEYGIPYTAELPIDPETAKLCDSGKVEEINTDQLKNLVSKL